MELSTIAKAGGEEAAKIPVVTDHGAPLDADEALLARFNKTQKLRRRFGTLSAIGVTCTLMITWETVTVTLGVILNDGGPTGIIIVYLVAWFGAILQGLVFAEMASMVPLAGGPFNWVALFAPTWCKKYLSYLAGWLTVISYIALVAATCNITGGLVQSAIQLHYPDYVPENWQGTLFLYALLFLSVFVNVFLGRILPQIESVLLFVHILGFVGIIIPILYLGPHQPASEVFQTFTDTGGWGNYGLAALVGSSAICNGFCGIDGADHIAEELHDASRAIPVAIGSSLLINGCLGFAMALALLFCMPSDILTLSQNSNYPFVFIYQYAVGSTSGATALLAVVIVAQIAGTIGVVATASRMIWAFARETGLPGSRFLAEVNPQTRLPIYSIAAVCVINLLLGLIEIGSSVGFSALLSLIVAGYYSSFILAAAVMLNKRLTSPDSDIPWGPFRLGRWGVPVTMLAIAYSVLGAFYSMWPTAVDPTIQTVNYCPLVYGTVMILSTLFWFVWGRRTYTGPIIEIQL